MTIEKGSPVIAALVQFRIAERTRRGNRHGSSSEHMYWALMRDHFQRSRRKGVVDPENRYGEKIYCDGCADRWEKEKHYRQQMVTNGHTKAELQSWDTQMREGLGDNAEYHQPRRLREQILLGRLKIKQIGGHLCPVKQHHEYQLAVKIVKEREQQRIASRNLGQEEQKTHPSSSSSSQWMAGGRVRGGTNRGNGKNKSPIASSQKLECL